MYILLAYKQARWNILIKKGGVLRVRRQRKNKHPDFLAALQARGLSQADGARFLGISPTEFGEMINCDDIPARVVIPEFEKKLIEFTGKTIEQLWPELSNEFIWKHQDYLTSVPQFTHRMLEYENTRDHLLDPEEAFDRIAVHEQLLQVIDQLPQDLKEVVLLRVYESSTFEHIGQILGISSQIASSRWNRALWKMKRDTRIVEIYKTYFSVRYGVRIDFPKYCSWGYPLTKSRQWGYQNSDDCRCRYHYLYRQQHVSLSEKDASESGVRGRREKMKEKCIRSIDIDLHIQGILLDPQNKKLETAIPRAVHIMTQLTQKDRYDAVVDLGVLVRKYEGKVIDGLVPEIDELIEVARIRAENNT